MQCVVYISIAEALHLLLGTFAVQMQGGEHFTTPHHHKKVVLKTQTSHSGEFDMIAIPRCGILFTEII